MHALDRRQLALLARLRRLTAGRRLIADVAPIAEASLGPGLLLWPGASVGRVAQPAVCGPRGRWRVAMAVGVSARVSHGAAGWTCTHASVCTCRGQTSAGGRAPRGVCSGEGRRTAAALLRAKTLASARGVARGVVGRVLGVEDRGQHCSRSKTPWCSWIQNLGRVCDMSRLSQVVCVRSVKRDLCFAGATYGIRACLGRCLAQC